MRPVPKAALIRGRAWRCRRRPTRTAPRAQTPASCTTLTLPSLRRRATSSRKRSASPQRYSGSHHFPTTGSSPVWEGSARVSGANLHDSQAWQPLVRGIPPIRSRRGPRRCRPASSTATSTCAYGSADATSVTASPGRESNCRPGRAVTDGSWSGRCPGSRAAAAYTATTHAKPNTSWRSQASPQPSSAHWNLQGPSQ